MSGDTCPWCGANIVCGKDYSCGSDSYGAVPRQSDLCKYRCAERRLSELGSELSLAAETIKRQAQRIAELERDNAAYLKERQQIRELAGHGNHEYGPDLVQCVKRQAERITELESALFCINCNGTGRDWDQHGEFDCCHCKAAEIRRAAKTGGK